MDHLQLHQTPFLRVHETGSRPERGEAAAGKRNTRNGYSKKRVLTETSKLDLRIPRDREGTFDPKLIARYQRRFASPAPGLLAALPISGDDVPPGPGRFCL